MAINRGITLLDPVIQGMTAIAADPMKWFRLEEELLLLGLDDRVTAAIVREMRFLHRKWRLEEEGDVS